MDEKKEKVITTEDVLEFLWTAVLLISGIVAVFALIWAEWFVFRVAVSIIVGLLICTGFGWYMANKFSRK